MLLAPLVALALSPAVADISARHTVEMRFRVVDEAGKPVAGASVFANMSSKTAVANWTATTGPDGVAAVRRPKLMPGTRVWVSADGYAGLFRGWEPGGELPPSGFRFVMPRATSIGGRVTDESGNPVAGARIAARCTLPKGLTLADGVSYNSYLSDGDQAISGADGRWSLANVPAPATAFALKVMHPDYSSDNDFGETQAAQGVTTAQLRAGAALVKLSSGARLSGTVTDADGQPVPNARVVYVDQPQFAPGETSVRADSTGRYRLPTLKPGRHPVTVIANGHPPERRDLLLEAGTRTEDFKLGAPNSLRVTIVDEAGAPVPKAALVISSWRGSGALYGAGIPQRANAGGEYAWHWAPSGPVSFEAIATGYQPQKLDLAADGKTHTVTLRRTLVVAGAITDALTGKPVANARVTPVIDFGRDLYAVERQDSFKADGSYRTEFERSDCDYRLLVEAPGYRTAISRAGLLKDRVSAEDFKLEPAAPVGGRVLDAAGKPVAGARVSLATSIQELRYPDGNGRNLSATTDAAGAFSLPAQAERYALFVEHPGGTARVERDPNDQVGDLTLAPWASVSGVVWQHGKPAPGERVFCSPRGLRAELGAGPRVRIDFQVVTDEAGAFRFDRVPPGPYLTYAMLGVWRESPLTASERRSLDLRPGEAVKLDLNHGGATVAGRFRLAGESPAGLTFEYSINHLVRRTADTPGAGLDLSGGYDHRRLDEPAARDALAAHRRFFVKPTRAGEFRIGGVPSGDYWLVAGVYEKPEGCLTTPVGVAAVPVTVSARQAGGGETVEVGAVEVVVRLGPQVGTRLPDLALLDPSGKPINLAALAGRPVVLHAWAGWCSACPRDYAAIRQFYKQTPVGKVALVGLNFDADSSTAAELAAKHGFDWPQACVGTKSAEAASAKLGTSSVPLYLVIDAAGVVRYRGGDWAEAEKAAGAK